LIPLAQIRRARERIAGKVVPTPLLQLASESPATIYLKLENLQPLGSFKLRGALNAIVQRPAAELQAGVITASAGNMGQGVAWAARELGVPCAVVVPEGAAETKLAAIAIVNMDDSGDTAPAAAMAMMIVYCSAAVKALQVVLARAVTHRTQAWRVR